MDVVYKEPGKKPEIREINKDLETMQSLVGGYVEFVTLHNAKPFPDCSLVCNENGKLEGLDINFELPWGDSVCGNVFFTNRSGGSLSTGTIKKLLEVLG